jgi:hypothetical protein
VLLAYCGRTVKNESPMLLFPSGFDPHSTIFNAHRVAEGELYLVRDLLAVFKAFESGIENVVSFLTEGITAQQLEMLATLSLASVRGSFFADPCLNETSRNHVTGSRG